MANNRRTEIILFSCFIICEKIQIAKSKKTKTNPHGIKWIVNGIPVNRNKISKLFSQFKLKIKNA